MGGVKGQWGSRGWWGQGLGSSLENTNNRYCKFKSLKFKFKTQCRDGSRTCRRKGCQLNIFYTFSDKHHENKETLVRGVGGERTPGTIFNKTPNRQFNVI